MRIYSNPMEMVREVERDLWEMGVRYQSDTVQDQVVRDDPDYMTVELMAYQYSLKNPKKSALDEMLEYLDGNRTWAEAELLERFNGSLNPGHAWMFAREKWERFLRDGKFAYHYPERLHYQIRAVINELKRRPNTRQAIMTMYDVHQDLMNWGGRDRVPCSLDYHFILRDRILTVIYDQRSCDFLKFFATDVWITCGMLDYIAGAIIDKVDETRFIHSIHSLHAFHGDMKRRGIF